MSIPKDILQDNPGLGVWSILLAYRGSISHGMYLPNSDENSVDDKDVMGVCVPPIDYYFGLKQFHSHGTQEIMRDEWDIVIYEAKKFISLLAQGNPNVLSMLWLEPNYYLKTTDAGNLLIKHRDMFVGKHVYKAFTGYAYSQLHRMTHHEFNGHMGAKRKALVEKYGYDCYDAETTEFLTNHGWKFFDDVFTNDQLATLKIETHQLEFQNYLNKTDKLYSGLMYLIEPYGSRTFVTENHNLLVSPSHRNKKNNFSVVYDENKSNWHLESLNNILRNRRSHFHICNSPEIRKEEYSINDDYLKLAGLYVSEGTTNFYKDKVKSIRFTQKKKGLFVKIADELMNKYPLRKYEYEKETVWVLHGEIARNIYNDFGHKDEKKLPDWCLKLSNRQVEIFWESLMSGDGTIKKENETYYTNSYLLSSDIQAMLVSAGLPSSVYGPYNIKTEYGNVNMYHVSRSNFSNRFHDVYFSRILLDGNFPKNKKNGFPLKQKLVENKRVVCFEVPNGTLITRNKGKVAIHGNCKNAAHLIRLLRMGVEFLTDGQLYVLREDASQLLEIKKGEWTLEQVKTESDKWFALAEQAYINSKLPVKPNMEHIEALCMSVISVAMKELHYNG